MDMMFRLSNFVGLLLIPNILLEETIHKDKPDPHSPIMIKRQTPEMFAVRKILGFNCI